MENSYLRAHRPANSGKPMNDKRIINLRDGVQKPTTAQRQNMMNDRVVNYRGIKGGNEQPYRQIGFNSHQNKDGIIMGEG